VVCARRRRLPHEASHFHRRQHGILLQALRKPLVKRCVPGVGPELSASLGTGKVASEVEGAEGEAVRAFEVTTSVALERS
jgi:hypothetical protein